MFFEKDNTLLLNTMTDYIISQKTSFQDKNISEGEDEDVVIVAFLFVAGITYLVYNVLVVITVI